MAYELNASNLLNPVMLWSDLGSMVSRQSDFDMPSGVALSADLQRSALDLMMQGWMQGWTQWMSTLGTFASMAARLGQGLKSRDDAPGAMKAFLPISGGGKPARLPHSASGSRQRGSRADARGERGSMEHAFASGEPKRRRSTGRAKAKSRRSRST